MGPYPNGGCVCPKVYPIDMNKLMRSYFSVLGLGSLEPRPGEWKCEMTRQAKLNTRMNTPAPISRGRDNVIPFVLDRPGLLSPAVPEYPAQATAAMRIILVEWRIRKDHEDEFLEYWSSRATVADRSGLIGEFLSRVESRNEYPWIVWELDERWTTFVNVGLWREGAEFQQQVGRFIDDARPPMAFEAERRRRVLVAPERWRTGGTALPVSEHQLVN
jgi:hypothetical protein